MTLRRNTMVLLPASPPFFTLISIAVLILTNLPYLSAVFTADDFVFGGFLFNPIDGNTYLAKMYQGWQGGWRFTLPYTAEPGRGAYLFLFYIFLGQLARWLGLSLPLVFHLARLIGTAGLLLALYRFWAVYLPEPRQRDLAFALSALGSGLGWMLVSFGAFTADFWVAETYPFLSSFATPHFALGLALLLFLLAEREFFCLGGSDRLAFIRWRLAAVALALSVISPFGVVVALVVVSGMTVWQVLSNLRGGRQFWVSAARSITAGPLLWILMGGMPLLVYDLWVARADPILAGWNAQNQTPSPPPWDLLVSLSPAFLLGLAGVLPALRRGLPKDRLLLVWACAGFLLLYLPFGLQRRFMMGLWVPWVGLAVLGVKALASKAPSREKLLSGAAIFLALPTNLIILLAALHGIQSRDPKLYLLPEEARALAWVAEYTPAGSLVLAAPETSLFIPAHTGRRVVYGHPFETVNAEAEKAAVLDFFRSSGSATFVLEQHRVDYIFLGPRERELGDLPGIPGWQVVYSAGGVEIYATGK